MRKFHLFTLGVAVITTVACGSDSSTGPAETSIAGTYALKTVNSTPLPYTMPDDGSGSGTIVILADSYTLAADGTYTGVTRVRLTSGGTSNDTDVPNSGKYVRSGNSVTLTDSSDPTDKVTGSIGGGTLTISVDGFVLVYQQSGS